MRNVGLLVASLFLLLAVPPASAQSTPSRAPTSTVEVHTLPAIGPQKAAAPFDTAKAVNAYLGTVSGEARARSDAYFEGGYYLLLVDTLYALAISALLLWGRVSSSMRNNAKRVTRSPFWQVPLYALQYIAATTVLALPLTIYEGFIREHAYGLSNQNFLQWFGEFGISFALEMVLGTLALMALYAVIRRAGRYWWIWGTLVGLVFMVIGLVFAPVFIEPLFNTYKPMSAGPLREQVLSLARANDIPADNVYVFDASRQSRRISANVAGFMGTTRIAMNDNLLNRTTPAETLAVLGHEMGHYVLDHSVRLLLFMVPLLALGLGLTQWLFSRLTGVFGGNWNVREVEDPAGLPVLAAILTLYMFVLTPLTNTISRTTEAQADIFGLNAARQPDGFATVTVKLSEYRKLDPTPLEEFFFYDHPSGRSRVTMAMVWKAEHLNDPDIKAGPVSPQ